MSAARISGIAGATEQLAIDVTRQNVRNYLMSYYDWRRSHSADGCVPSAEFKKLITAGNSISHLCA